MSAAGLWRTQQERYRLRGIVWSDGSVHFPPKPEPAGLGVRKDVRGLEPMVPVLVVQEVQIAIPTFTHPLFDTVTQHGSLPSRMRVPAITMAPMK